MRVNPISFKGGYREELTCIGADSLDNKVIKALDKARPYLRQIGNSMPCNRDLYVTINSDPCDTILSAYDYNNKNKKAKLLAQVTEHTVTEHGFDFVDKVFKGLEKNCKFGEFKDIASDFVKKFHFIQNELHPIKYTHIDCDDIHPACCDY